MKKPIIGIVGRVDVTKDDDKVICIWENSRRSIIKEGGIPILILPPQDIIYEDFSPKDVNDLTDNEKEDLRQVVNMCDGILIPGGFKVYEYDRFIYSYARELDKPILGICAGMQLIARMNDNTVEKNDVELDHFKPADNYVHDINIVGGTLLEEIIGQNRIKVNSKHRYHVTNSNNLTVGAYSEDGLIEALEDQERKFVLGVQWHPESMLEYDENANKIFDRFIKECQK